MKGTQKPSLKILCSNIQFLKILGFALIFRCPTSGGSSQSQCFAANFVFWLSSAGTNVFLPFQASGTYVLWTDHEETTKHSLRIIIWGLDWWRVSPHDSRGSFCLILIYNPAVWGLHWSGRLVLRETPNATDIRYGAWNLLNFQCPSVPFLCRLRVGIVYRHAGAHGIFVDLGFFGNTGCWQNNCRSIPQPRLDCQNAPCLPGTQGIQTSSTVRTTSGDILGTFVPRLWFHMCQQEMIYGDAMRCDCRVPQRFFKSVHRGPRHLRASLLAGEGSFGDPLLGAFYLRIRGNRWSKFHEGKCSPREMTSKDT